MAFFGRGNKGAGKTADKTAGENNQAQLTDEQKLIQELVDNELVTFRKIYLKDRKIENLIGVGKVTLVLYRRIMREVNQRDRITLEEFNRFYDALGRMTLDQIEEDRKSVV